MTNTLGDVLETIGVKPRVDETQFTSFEGKEFIDKATNYNKIFGSNFSRHHMYVQAAIGQLEESLGYLKRLKRWGKRNLSGCSDYKIHDIIFAETILSGELEGLKDQGYHKLIAAYKKTRGKLEKKRDCHKAHQQVHLLPKDQINTKSVDDMLVKNYKR